MPETVTRSTASPAAAGDALDLLAELVRLESHVSLPDGVRAVGEVVARELRAAGFACTWEPCEPVVGAEWIAELLLGDPPPERLAPALVASRPGTGARVLLLGDLDTAHAPGSLARNPFRVEDGRALGPGVADMKGGLVVLCLALRALADRGLPAPELTVVLSPDEQAGSLGSRAIVERAAAGADRCLCMECARDGGKLMAARAQVGIARLDVHGREAYAGHDRAKGASAIAALARKLPDVDAVSEDDVHVTATLVAGGRRRSVVPGHAWCTIDLRAGDAAGWERAEAALAGIARRDDGEGTRGELRAYAHRPAVPWDDALLSEAVAAGRELGLRLEALRSPAAGSSAFAAAAGVPTLDGMGPSGGALMTDDEFVEVDSIVERAEVLALLLSRLAGPDPYTSPRRTTRPETKDGQ